MPSDRTVVLNDDVGLVCVASGIPDVDYSWFRMDTRGLVDVVLNDRVSENNGTLNITMATRQDAGMYVCVASNELGNITSTTAQLTVLGMCAACCVTAPLTFMSSPQLPPFPLRIYGTLLRVPAGCLWSGMVTLFPSLIAILWSTGWLLNLHGLW